jgi:hypothetical protein
MKVDGILPDATSLTCFLKCYMYNNAMARAYEMVKDVDLRRDLESNPVLANILICLYA